MGSRAVPRTIMLILLVNPLRRVLYSLIRKYACIFDEFTVAIVLFDISVDIYGFLVTSAFAFKFNNRI